MTTITIEVHQAADCLPDADTDVLVLAEGDEETQLGALVGNEPQEWVDANGESLRVVAWAELPRLATEPRDLVTLAGQRVDLAAPWAIPV